ncbi:hypothetical protein MRB53_034371 [Persea americana]|uniref:Uncharacterized protein n=1 Tax=Persea americana TaxID=3435 RepID=A0ACC2KX30_PERAE|nr:hypothetical protein MRB53_034371 [Persea americana]
MQKETFQPDRGDQIAVEGSFTPGRPDGREDLKKIEDLHFLPSSSSRLLLFFSTTLICSLREVQWCPLGSRD